MLKLFKRFLHLLQHFQGVVEVLPVQVGEGHGLGVDPWVLQRLHVGVDVADLPHYLHDLLRDELQRRALVQVGERRNEVLLVQSHIVGPHDLELPEALLELIFGNPLVVGFLLKDLLVVSNGLFLIVEGSLLEGSILTNPSPSGQEHTQIPPFVPH